MKTSGPSVQPPALSVVIPCRGHAEELAYCLQGLEAQEGGVLFETIVVDSASDPGVQAVAARFPRVLLITSPMLLSAGAARNLGARHAGADTLGFIDADCIPGPGWVKAALQAVADGAVIAGGPILDVLPWHFVAASDNRLQFVDFPGHRPAGTHPYLPGTHLVMPRTVFERAGGFEEAATVAQDVLLTAPVAANQPGNVRFCPDMIVQHWGRRRWNEFLEHHRVFGESRAVHRFRVDRSLDWLGRHSALAWVIVLRRLAYITLRVLQWNLLDLPRFILQLPILLCGLVSWTSGFIGGMRPPLPINLEAKAVPGNADNPS
jgi:glycosyltransferase involved in cell wall biosynthesis